MRQAGDEDLSFDLIVVGHLTHDIIVTPQGRHEALGGTAAYTSAAAARLGGLVGVVAKVGRDFRPEYPRALQRLGVNLLGLRVEEGETTTFENVYDEMGNRTQRVLSVMKPIGVEDIPPPYLRAKCFHFGPIFHEVPYELIIKIHKMGILTSLDPQGYCRARGPNQAVRATRWSDAPTVLPHVDILKCDEREAEMIVGVRDPRRAAAEINRLGPKIALVTMGARGSILAFNGVVREIPAIPPGRVVDPTGAGDAYSAGFILEYLESHDPERSAIFASALASFVVEGVGLTGLPTREAVLRRLHAALGRDKAERAGFRL